MEQICQGGFYSQRNIPKSSYSAGTLLFQREKALGGGNIKPLLLSFGLRVSFDFISKISKSHVCFSASGRIGGGASVSGASLTRRVWEEEGEGSLLTEYFQLPSIIQNFGGNNGVLGSAREVLRGVFLPREEGKCTRRRIPVLGGLEAEYILSQIN